MIAAFLESIFKAGLFLAVLSLPFPVLALPWQSAPGFLHEDEIRRLSLKHSDISSPFELQDLLIDLVGTVPVSDVYAEKRESAYVIYGTRALVVKDIELRLTSRTYKEDIEGIATPLIGSVDSKGLRDTLLSSIKNYLNNRGYPNAEIKLETEEEGPFVLFSLKVRYGSPCLIAQIDRRGDLPKKYQLDVEVGDLCDLTTFRKDLRDIELELKDDGFNQAQVAPLEFSYDKENNTMKLDLGGTIGKKVLYEIADDANSISISDLFGSEEREKIDPSLVSVDAMNAELTARYRNQGYDDVVVEPPSKRETPDSIIYTFKVLSGRKYVISNIQFQGVTVFPTDELSKDLIETGWFESKPPLSVSQLQTGVDRIRARYQAAGYWDVKISDPRISKNAETGEASVTIIIEEGFIRRLALVQIEGETVFPQDELRAKLKLQRGDPLDQAELANFEKGVKELYVEKGYLHIKTEIVLEANRGTEAWYTNVVLKVYEGPQVHVGNISVTGLTFTKEEVVLRELYFKSGDPYNPEDVDSSRRALLALGIFRSAQIVPADRNALLEKVSVLDLRIEIKEAKPGNVAFGPGWSLYRGARFNVESSYNNIGGTGRQVFSRLRFSEESNQEAIGRRALIGRNLSVGYLEPYILDLPINGTISGTNSARADDKWTITQAGELALSHKFRRGFLRDSTLSTFYGLKINREVSSERQKEGYLDLLGGDVRIGQVGLRYTWDFRNDITWPTRGLYFATELARARYELGGDLSYYYWKLQNSYYYGFWQRFVVALGYELEAYTNVDRRHSDINIVPQSEALYAGGAESVRGFRERTLGPRAEYDVVEEGQRKGRSNDAVLGASHSGLYKLELRYQIVPNTFAITTFVDSGNVFFTNKEVKNFDDVEGRSDDPDDEFESTEIVDNVPYHFEEMITHPDYLWSRNYVAHGFSLNYLTPLGSVNLAYGLPWKRCAKESDTCIERGKREKNPLLDGQIHLNVGATF